MGKLKIRREKSPDKTLYTVRTYYFQVQKHDGSRGFTWFVEDDIDLLHKHIVLFALRGYEVWAVTEHWISENERATWGLGTAKQSGDKRKTYDFPWESGE